MDRHALGPAWPLWAGHWKQRMHGAQPAAILNARRRHGLPHFCGVETHVIARHRLNPGHRPTTIMRESSPMARMLRCTDGFIEPLTGTAEAGTRRPKLTSRSTPLPSRVEVVCQVPLPRARASCVWRLATSFQFNQREKERELILATLANCQNKMALALFGPCARPSQQQQIRRNAPAPWHVVGHLVQ